MYELIVLIIASAAALAVVQTACSQRRRRRMALEDLDALFVEGVNRCNFLIPAREDFAWANADHHLAAWEARVLRLLERHANFSEVHNFRTLFEFNGRSTAAEGKSPQQNQMEAIWRRKLELLRGVIDRLGS